MMSFCYNQISPISPEQKHILPDFDCLFMIRFQFFTSSSCLDYLEPLWSVANHRITTQIDLNAPRVINLALY